MDNLFADTEKLYRAVFPASIRDMYWKKDGSVSSAAFLDKEGLSVERGYFRNDNSVVEQMREFFKGCIISVTAGQCKEVSALVKYMPTNRSKYHSEIHGSDTQTVLSPAQRKRLATMAKMEYYIE